MIRPSKSSEQALEAKCWGQGPRKCDGWLCEAERLFILPRFQQSLRETEHTDDLCPGVLALLRERECPATTLKAQLHLPTIHLCKRQHRLGQHRAPGTLPGTVWPPQSLPHEYGSSPGKRDFWLPVPGPVCLVPVRGPAVHATRRALGPPTRPL